MTTPFRFSGLEKASTIGSEDPDPETEEHGDEDADTPEPEPEPEADQGRNDKPKGRAMSYAVPVAPGTHVHIEGDFPLTEAQWNRLMLVLEAMKDGLVENEADSLPNRLHPS